MQSARLSIFTPLDQTLNRDKCEWRMLNSLETHIIILTLLFSRSRWKRFYDFYRCACRRAEALTISLLATQQQRRYNYITRIRQWRLISVFVCRETSSGMKKIQKVWKQKKNRELIMQLSRLEDQHTFHTAADIIVGLVLRILFFRLGFLLLIFFFTSSFSPVCITRSESVYYFRVVRVHMRRLWVYERG